MIWTNSCEQLNPKLLILGKILSWAKSHNITDRRTNRVIYNRTRLLTCVYVFSLSLPFFSRQPIFSLSFRRFF